MPRLVEDQLNINMPGAWNTAILTPDWFRRQFPDWFREKEFQVQFLQNTQIGALVRFKFERVLIEPSSTQLIIRPVDAEGEDLNFTSELAAAIVRKLEHTPILAVGHNVHFEIAENEAFAIEKFVNDEGLNGFYESIGLKHRQNYYRHSFSFEDHNLNITYDGIHVRRQIAFNFHYPTAVPEKIEQALMNFSEDFKQAKKYANELIGEKNDDNS